MAWSPQAAAENSGVACCYHCVSCAPGLAKATCWEQRSRGALWANHPPSGFQGVLNRQPVCPDEPQQGEASAQFGAVAILLSPDFYHKLLGFGGGGEGEREMNLAAGAASLNMPEATATAFLSDL